MDHDAVSVDLATEILPAFDYSRTQVASIVRLIMVTRLPQTPNSLLEEIIADTDLDSLERADFQEERLALVEDFRQGGKPGIGYAQISLTFLRLATLSSEDFA